MTRAELKDAVLGDLGEAADTGGFHTAGDAYVALDRAQQIFALATLCIERIAPITLAAATTFQALGIADLIVPFTVRLTSNGRRLEPKTLADLTAYSLYWMGETGVPVSYGVSGVGLLHVYKKVASPTSLDILYAAAPATIPTEGPEIPAEYHSVLVDWAVVRARLKEGATPLQTDMQRLNAFWTAAQKCAAVVRARCQTMGYDVSPPEIRIPDFSRAKKVKYGD